MTDKQLMRDIDRNRRRQPVAFWGLWISIVSIIYGEFIVRVDGYLLAHSEPYFARIPENPVGALLVIAGVIKLVGVVLDDGLIKKIGILSLSAMWTGIFIVALTFSFGSGYPHPSYIFMGFMMIGCFRISLKGDFGR